MAYVIAAPEMMAAAAADLAAIGSNVSAAHLVAAARTTSVTPAAADEVSAAIASVFANHAQAFQGLAGKAAAFHDQFVQTLNSGGAAYAQTEATSAPGLRALFRRRRPGFRTTCGCCLRLSTSSPSPSSSPSRPSSSSIS